MLTFFKYAVGALVLGAFIAFLVNNIRSFIDALREHRDKKKSPEKASTEPEKVESEDGKGGAPDNL